jgi:uncharacterized protein (TIGR02284 family)
MATHTIDAVELVEELNRLIHLDYDAVHAYDAAIDRLDDEASRDALTRFRADHARHIDELQRLVRKLGGEPTDRADVKRVLTQGMVVIRGLQGDHGVLTAMKQNEDQTNAAYERAVALEGLTGPIREVLDRNLVDERRHRAWIEQRLEHLDRLDTST